MFNVFNTSATPPANRRLIATVGDMEAAQTAIAQAGGGIVLFECDADHPGCADAFTNSGDLFVVEPVRS